MISSKLAPFDILFSISSIFSKKKALNSSDSAKFLEVSFK
jgi:hypothetical protein